MVMNIKLFVWIAISYLYVFQLLACVSGGMFFRGKQHFLTQNPVIDKQAYSSGRILIVPMGGKGDLGLYNKKGYFEKIWKTGRQTAYGELMGKDKLLLTHKLKKGNKLFPLNTGLIAVYNFKGQMEASFEDPSLFHDIAIKRPFRILALSRGVKKIKRKGKTIRIVDESIVEIDLKQKEILKRIPLLDIFPIPNNLTPHLFQNNLFDLFHSNSLDYIEKNPINSHPAVLITMRKYNRGTVALIDLKNQSLLWQSPQGFFLHPHDGKFTQEKTITVFDNGDTKNIYKRMSRVVEMDIQTNKILWEYDGAVKSPIYKQFFQWQMFSPWAGGAQKTKKGYLIISSMSGRIFEVSKDKKIVWDLPAAASVFRAVNGGVAIPIFKARQY